MVKKGTKRKTRWRTLSIGDGGATDDAASDTGKTEHHNYNRSGGGGVGDLKENLHVTSSTRRLTNGLYAKTTLQDSQNYIASRNNNDHSRHHFYKNSDKVPFSSRYRNNSTTSLSSYKRRTSYQSASSSRYRPNPIDRSTHHHMMHTSRSSDQNICDKDTTSTTKPLFNEDEYTRITTPRQDVLFKKGYLSRPKRVSTTTATIPPLPTATPTSSSITPSDSKTSSSGAVSVTSTEESMSSSTQSVSPEHCNLTSDLNDVDNPLLYPGFYDQNGVFFVNPYMTNGFDPYGGQLIMMPYDGPPYSINPTEYYSQDCVQPPYPMSQQKRNSIDSQTTPTTPSSHDEQSTSASSPPVTEQYDGGDTPSDSPSTNKGDENYPDTIESSGMLSEQQQQHCAHPPQYFYPFMFGPPPQFLPLNELGYNEYNGYGAPYNKFNRFKKRKKIPYKYCNSTGVSATTTDYSEDDDSTDNERLHQRNNQPSDEGYESNITSAQNENIVSKSTLNTNVSEFVPRRMQTTTLNVEVPEFQPRSYRNPQENYQSSIQEQNEETKGDVLKNRLNKTQLVVKEQIELKEEKELKVQKKFKELPEQKELREQKGPSEMNEQKELKQQMEHSVIQSSKLKSNRSKDNKCMLNSSDSRRNSDINKDAKKIVDDAVVKADVVISKTDTSPKRKGKIQLKQNTKTKTLKTNNNSPKKLKTLTNIEISVPNSSNSVITDSKTDEKLNENITEKSKLISDDSTKLAKNNNKLTKNENTDPPITDQPTYAQMLGPSNSPEKKTNKKSTKIEIENQQELIDLSAAIKESQKLNDTKPIVWQTVKPKGRKKHQKHIFIDDPWLEEQSNDCDDNPVVENCVQNEVLRNSNESTEKVEVEQPTTDTDQLKEIEIIDDRSESSENQPKTNKINKKLKQDKAKLKTKTTKKSQKKILKDPSVTNSFNENVVNQLLRSSSTPNKTDTIPSVTQIDTKTKSVDYIDDIDISDYNFESNPSIFVNAITNGIFMNKSDKSVTGNTGFGLNSSLSLMNKYDFGKVKESALLKEEEEMVMSVMRSLSQQEKIENKTDEPSTETDVKLLKTDQLDDEKVADMENPKNESVCKSIESVNQNESTLNKNDGGIDEEEIFFKIIQEMNIKIVDPDNNNEIKDTLNQFEWLNHCKNHNNHRQLSNTDEQQQSKPQHIDEIIRNEVCKLNAKNSTDDHSNNDLKLDHFYANMENMFKQVKNMENTTTTTTTTTETNIHGTENEGVPKETDGKNGKVSYNNFKDSISNHSNHNHFENKTVENDHTDIETNTDNLKSDTCSNAYIEDEPSVISNHNENISTDDGLLITDTNHRCSDIDKFDKVDKETIIYSNCNENHSNNDGLLLTDYTDICPDTDKIDTADLLTEKAYETSVKLTDEENKRNCNGLLITDNINTSSDTNKTDTSDSQTDEVNEISVNSNHEGPLIDEVFVTDEAFENEDNKYQNEEIENNHIVIEKVSVENGDYNDESLNENNAQNNQSSYISDINGKVNDSNYISATDTDGNHLITNGYNLNTDEEMCINDVTDDTVEILTDTISCLSNGNLSIFNKENENTSFQSVDERQIYNSYGDSRSDTDITSELSSEDDDDGENTVIDQIISGNRNCCDIETDLIIDEFQCDDETSVMITNSDGNDVCDDINTDAITTAINTDQIHNSCHKITNDDNERNIFIETEIIVPSKELNIFMTQAKSGDRSQSPRHSEDSGILEYPNIDDVKDFSDSEESKCSNDINNDDSSAIQKFPITEAVSRWLQSKQKEKSPEPILRLPNDPVLTEQLERSIMKRFNVADYFRTDNDVSSDSETEYEFKTPTKSESKNFKSNPVRASLPSTKGDIVRKRVASDTSDEHISAEIFDEPDILECWEIDPEMKKRKSLEQELLESSTNGHQEIDEIEPYQSVYGTTINYNNVLANKDDLFLSNNILFNDNFKQETNANGSISNNNNKSLLLTAATTTKTTTNNNNNNNTTNDDKISTSDKDDLKDLNFVKPPEICCILM